MAKESYHRQIADLLFRGFGDWYQRLMGLFGQVVGAKYLISLFILEGDVKVARVN